MGAERERSPRPRRPVGTDLSDAELKLLAEIWAEHGGKDQWQLVEWCHAHCGEWTSLSRGCAPIAVERISQALGKAPEEVQKLAREAAEFESPGRNLRRHMIELGTALKSTEYPYHGCVVLSDPHANGSQIVLVRVTTDDGTWPDRDCLLGPSDWIELDRASTVAYSTCKYGPAVKSLESAIQKGWFT